MVRITPTMFCPACKKLMRPNTAQGLWICPKCGTNVKMGSGKVVEHHQLKAKEVAVVEQKVNPLPVSKEEECPKCGHNEAYWVLGQTRGADEPETRIFQCTKCDHKWREYQ